MTARLLRMIREVQPAGPYRVAGWSFGGVLAYEIASQLVGQNETVEFVGLIDTAAPAYFRAVDAMPEMADSVDGDGDAELEAYVARLRAEGMLRDHVTVPQFREMREQRRVNVQALREFDPRPLPVAVHLFPARENPLEDLSHLWRDLLPERALQVTFVPGTHSSMMDPPNVAVLGEALSRGLDAAASRRAPGAEPGRHGAPVPGAAGASPIAPEPGAG
jgi:thioesterase domain-containing protein